MKADQCEEQPSYGKCAELQATNKALQSKKYTLDSIKKMKGATMATSINRNMPDFNITTGTPVEDILT